jgi:predicted nucleic acid-binding protein
MARWGIHARPLRAYLAGVGPHTCRSLLRGSPSSDEATTIIALLANNATVIDLTLEVHGVATHAEDDLVLSTALSGQAGILCTRDKQLLNLRSYQSVSILSPGELVVHLEAGPPS